MSDGFGEHSEVKAKSGMSWRRQNDRPQYLKYRGSEHRESLTACAKQSDVTRQSVFGAERQSPVLNIKLQCVAEMIWRTSAAFVERSNVKSLLGSGLRSKKIMRQY